MIQITVSRIFVFLGVFGISNAFGPPPFLNSDSQRFLENFHRDFFNGASPINFGQIQGQMRYKKDPIDFQAGFHLRPPGGVQSSFPHLLPPSFLPNMLNNFKTSHQTFFTPSRGGERPETPGQVKAYEDDLKEQDKENQNALNELTTDNYSDEITGFSESPTSYVNVGFTAGDSTLKYSYSV
ncbi:hypothetical protein WA026_021083 [Henosepilachna vigintioctopunctata]|uniref:Uncharacterized protein n=1 Tax=Henosepilachna vigintioctopunctata TaxID=420089 RepID=A0AAW1V4N7_9CUCU